MTDQIIKICGMRDPKMAAQAAHAGANFIGIIFHPLSPRHANLDQAAAISAAVNKAGALPVAVFVDQTDIEMHHICKVTNIHVIQLHGTTARAHHHFLPDDYQRIYVQHVSDQGEVRMDEGLQHLNASRDFILIDHIEPGQGKSINRLSFSYHLPFRWILAGGLSPSNVVAAINDLQPNGVDVSSGVESFKGKKDISLIQAFITSVRGHHVT
jgi:phosphoribosylanthranilate isomerase